MLPFAIGKPSVIGRLKQRGGEALAREPSFVAVAQRLSRPAVNVRISADLCERVAKCSTLAEFDALLGDVARHVRVSAFGCVDVAPRAPSNALALRVPFEQATRERRKDQHPTTGVAT